MANDFKADILSFEKSFDIASRKVLFETKETVKEAISITLKAIVADTPVGDLETGKRIAGQSYKPGNLRGNWQISFDSPASNEIDRKDPSGSKAISDINSHMNSYVLTDTVFFTNNANYAERIEFEGGSRKAPQGMMRINVIKFNGVLMSLAQSKGGR